MTPEPGVRHDARTLPAQVDRSFYWRIALFFVACVLLVSAAQALMFRYQMESSPELKPNNRATLVAAGLSAALAGNPKLDVTHI